MVNKVVLIGRLGHDPSLRYTTDGQAVVNFTLATDERWTDQAGQKQEKTEWHNIVIFGKLAETCKEYLSKGRLIYIEGRLQTREWETRQGDPRRTTEVIANQMKILDNKKTEERETVLANPWTEPETELNITDDDIPF